MGAGAVYRLCQFRRRRVCAGALQGSEQGTVAVATQARLVGPK